MSALIGNPLLLTSAPAADDDSYQISKSLRFESADSSYLQRTPYADGNRKTYTIAFWWKQSKANSVLWQSGNGSGQNYIWFHHESDGQIRVYDTTLAKDNTWSQNLRDSTAWQHICFVMDTNNDVADDRIRLYINGRRDTNFQTKNMPTQSADGENLRAGVKFNIGRNEESVNYFNGYLSDFYTIDGLALSPAAFGSYDASGSFNPKEYTRPAPNDGTTWSSSVSGTAHGSFPWTNAFDGKTSTYMYAAANADATWTPSSPIKGTTIEIFMYAGGSNGFPAVVVNGNINYGDPAGGGTDYNGVWVDVSKDCNYSLTSIKAIGLANKQSGFAAVRIDGVILVDGQTDSTSKNNPNNGTTWSSGTITGAAYQGNAGNSWPVGFNGTLALDSNDEVEAASNSPAYKLVLAKSVPFSTGVKVYIRSDSDDPDSTFKVNNVDQTGNIPDGTNLTKGVVQVNCTGISSPLTSVEVGLTSGSTFVGLQGIEVDGYLLVNDTVDNSFHLKFDDVTAKRNLGYSQVTNTPTGAHPMYGPGSTDTAGDSTDTAKSSLVWALPGYDTADHSHTIKGSGSAVNHTVNGAVVSTTQSKFYGSSLYFDGSNDEINSPVSTDFQLGTSNFTIEGWFYMPSSGFVAADGWIQCSAGNDDWSMLPFYRSSDGNLYFYGTATAGDWDWQAKNYGAIATNEWTHYAVVRNGSTFKGYTNGKEAWTFTDSGTVYQAENQMTIGSSQNGGNAFAIGFLNDFRYYKGAAKYTADFIPPTRNDFSVNNLNHDDNTSGSTPISSATGGRPIYATNDFGDIKDSPVAYRTDSSAGTTSGTGLVLAVPGDTVASTACDVHQQINSNSSNKSASANNGTAVSTDYSKYYSSGAINLDGTDDTLSFGASADFDFGSGNVTVECWLYLDAHAGDKTIVGIWTGWQLVIGAGASNDKFAFMMYDGSNVPSATSSAGSASYVGKWVHLAGVRNGNTLKLYVNGQEDGSASMSGSHTSTSSSTLYIGGRSSGYNINGRIQDLRIYKGVAKYTSNFTLPDDQRNVTAIDSYTDTPTNYGTDGQNGAEVRGNYATLNGLQKHSDISLQQGGLALDKTTGNAWKYTKATLGMKTGKWYCEIGPNLYNTNFNHCQPGISVMNDSNTTSLETTSGHCMYHYSGKLYKNNTNANWGDAWSSDNSIIGIAFDADTRKFWFSKDGVWQASGNPASGSNEGGVLDLVNDGTYAFTLGSYGTMSADIPVNFGQRPWKYTAPSGFNALCTKSFDNIFDGEDSENNPSKYFDIKLWTGTGADHDIKGLDFQPDFVWIKNRDVTGQNLSLHDVVRGATKPIYTDENNAEATQTSNIELKQFYSDGFQVADNDRTNDSEKDHVGWCWDAGTAASGANNDGSINISSGNQWKNATAGFSITKYVSNNTAGATVGHGLGAVPEFILIKLLDDWGHWAVYHKDLGNTKMLKLNLTDAEETDSSSWNNTSPTNTVFTIGNSDRVNNNDDENYIAYCWTTIPGFSSFGKYIGNGSDTGPYIYTGFRPKFLMLKASSDTGSWTILDSERLPFNPAGDALFSDGSWAEIANRNCDLLSNGFKVRDSDGGFNTNGGTILYVAFAEHPFKTARAK